MRKETAKDPKTKCGSSKESPLCVCLCVCMCMYGSFFKYFIFIYKIAKMCIYKIAKMMYYIMSTLYF